MKDYSRKDTRAFCLECRARADAEERASNTVFAANARASPMLSLEPDCLDIIYLALGNQDVGTTFNWGPNPRKARPHSPRPPPWTAHSVPHGLFIVSNTMRKQ